MVFSFPLYDLTQTIYFLYNNHHNVMMDIHVYVFTAVLMVVLSTQPVLSYLGLCKGVWRQQKGDLFVRNGYGGSPVCHDKETSLRSSHTFPSTLLTGTSESKGMDGMESFFFFEIYVSENNFNWLQCRWGLYYHCLSHRT